MTFRSLLFVPGARPDRFEKAMAANADAVCIDLEDAVAPDLKADARREAHAFLKKRPQGAAVGLRINALRSASTHIKPEADRTKKLLMHRAEIRRLIGKTEQKGFTLVPLNLHWKGGRVKADIALAKGKAEHDKRNTIKDRDWEREKGRLMRHKVSSPGKD